MEVKFSISATLKRLVEKEPDFSTNEELSEHKLRCYFTIGAFLSESVKNTAFGVESEDAGDSEHPGEGLDASVSAADCGAKGVNAGDEKLWIPIEEYLADNTGRQPNCYKKSDT